MRHLTNRTFLWWLLLLATIPSFFALLRSGFLPIHDDLPVVRLYALNACILDGQVPCRWTKELGFGYGYPLMNFYPPLPYIVGLLPRAMGLSLIDTTKLLFILGFVLSAGFMARLANLFFDRWVSLAAALFFLYGPYHAVDLYVRGDLNELWAIALFPAVLWTGYKLLKKPTFHNALALGLAEAGILLSHVGMALIMAPPMIIWLGLWLVYFAKDGFLKRLKNLVLAGVLSVGFSAFFVIPVLFEQPLVHVETLTIGYFNFLAHFVDLKQLFISRFWGYGASVWGPNDGLAFQIGIFHWSLALAASIGLLTWLRKDRRLVLVYLFFFALLLASAFLAHPKATSLWLKIPKLDYLQFPWRFLALVLPSVSLLAASLIAVARETLRPVLVGVSFFVLLFLYGSYFRPEMWFADRTDSLQFSGPVWAREITAGIFDYLPKWSTMPPGSPPAGDYLPAQGVTVQTIRKSSNYQEYLVTNSGTQKITFILNTLYYLGWQVKVNGQSVVSPIAKVGDLGLISAPIPPGKSTIVARFTETPVRMASDLASLLFWLFLLFYWYRGVVSRVMGREQSAGQKPTSSLPNTPSNRPSRQPATE